MAFTDSWTENLKRIPMAKLYRIVAIGIALVASAAYAESVVLDVPDSLKSVLQGQPPMTVQQLRDMESHVKTLAKKVIQSTVSVQFKEAHGSGVIVSEDGYVLTVAHVVGKPNEMVTVRLNDGRVLSARSLGMHLELDAGLVKIVDGGTFPHLKMSKTSVFRRGQWCGASGHPGGHDYNRGPVFRIGRILGKGDELIQTDCQLVGGDSGGPLVDLTGRVIGIHSRIGVSLATNFHVPISTYRVNWNELVDGKLWSSRAFIGVRGKDNANNAKIGTVHDKSPAAAAGMKVGDVVTIFDGVRIKDFPQLVQLVRQHQPGETVNVEVVRNGKKIEMQVTIGRRRGARS